MIRPLEQFNARTRSIAQFPSISITTFQSGSSDPRTILRMGSAVCSNLTARLCLMHGHFCLLLFASRDPLASRLQNYEL
eukprot:1898680-Amphidinium_carterae.1